jgi:hypothetical protein
VVDRRKRVEEGFHILRWNWDQEGDPDGDLDPKALKELVQVLQPGEESARQRLASRVALELDHR